MTLSSSTVRVQYDGDDSTVSFPITFVFWEATDIEVILTSAAGTDTTWVNGTQYSLSGGSGSTGTLTVDTSPTDYTPATGETLTIRSIRAYTQGTSLPLGGPLPSTSVERMVDQTVRLIQQANEAVGRAIKFATTSATSGVTFPEPSADKVVGWNAAGGDLENKTPNTSAYVTTPGSSTDNAVVRFNGAGGASFQNSGDTIDDNNIYQHAAQTRWKKGADIASASPLVLGTDGNYFDITGTNAITSIDTLAVGTVVKLHFDGALTLTHHSTDLILPGGANITTAAGDEAEFVEYAAGDWRCTSYTKATGRAVVPGAPLDVQTFTSSGTWTKPSAGSFAMIEIWGAGGGGARRGTGNASGGGGGSYDYFFMATSALSATETVTIGAGGAVQSTDNTDGNAGGDTSFGSHATSYGGRGGKQAAAGTEVRGGGAGSFGVDVWTTYSFADTSALGTAGVGMFQHNSGIAGNLTAFAAAIMSGTGVTSGNIAQTSQVIAMMGGGGGFSTTGPSTGLGVITAGPTGVRGGNGGNGNAAGAGVNGGNPGGGGGAGTTQGGSGGNGQIRVTVW